MSPLAKKTIAAVFILVLTLSGQVMAWTGPTSPDDFILTINGTVPKPRQLTAQDIAQLPHRTVETKAADGSTITYEGPLLSDVLSTAGVIFGPDLKGPALANYLLVTGADGFRVVFALPELDSSFTNRVIILADKRNGQPLTAAEGPLRSVVPDEKRQSRWVKQVITLTILNGTNRLSGRSRKALRLRSRRQKAVRQR